MISTMMSCFKVKGSKITSFSVSSYESRNFGIASLQYNNIIMACYADITRTRRPFEMIHLASPGKTYYTGDVDHVISLSCSIV